MAKNNGMKQVFNTTLQDTMEQERMNRRLKEAGIYDHNDSYEVRKQLDEMLQQSKEDAKKTEKSVSYEKTVSSFDDDFNIIDDDDDDLKEVSHAVTTTSTNRFRKKSPEFLSEDEDENHQTTGKSSSFKVETKTYQRNASKLQKAKLPSIDSKKLVQTPVSYGSKMVAASMKKSDDNTESPNSSRSLSSRRGDLIISPDEIDDADEFPLKIEPLKGSSRNGNSSSRKCETTTEKKSNDTDDYDFIDDEPPPRQKESYVNRPKPEQSNPSQKGKLGTMKTLCKKYSEMLNQIENVQAHPIPEDFDYDSKGPCQLLIENEEKLKATKSSGYKPIQWRKPIILSANSNRRRRQIFNQPSTSRTTPPVDAEEESVDAVEIVCDSPPAASMRKLDISPASPIFESNASRKRPGGSNGIIEAEMEDDRKSPIENKEDSAKQECPICGKLFSLSLIEGHADGCINNMEERPRSERIARNARSNKLFNAWSEHSQWGKGDRAASTSSETADTDVLFETDGSQPDSDFEPDQDPGTKRGQRKTAGVGVKKRRL